VPRDCKPAQSHQSRTTYCIQITSSRVGLKVSFSKYRDINIAQDMVWFISSRHHPSLATRGALHLSSRQTHVIHEKCHLSALISVIVGDSTSEETRRGLVDVLPVPGHFSDQVRNEGRVDLPAFFQRFRPPTQCKPASQLFPELHEKPGINSQGCLGVSPHSRG
jgi:hypothetical protein